MRSTGFRANTAYSSPHSHSLMKCYGPKQSNQGPTFPACRQLHYTTIAHVLESISNHFHASLPRPQPANIHICLCYSTCGLMIPIFHTESHAVLPKILPQDLPARHICHIMQGTSSIVQGHKQSSFNPHDLHSHILPLNQNKTSIQTGGKQTLLFLTPASYSI